MGEHLPPPPRLEPFALLGGPSLVVVDQIRGVEHPREPRAELKPPVVAGEARSLARPGVEDLGSLLREAGLAGVGVGERARIGRVPIAPQPLPHLGQVGPGRVPRHDLHGLRRIGHEALRLFRVPEEERKDRRLGVHPPGDPVFDDLQLLAVDHRHRVLEDEAAEVDMGAIFAPRVPGPVYSLAMNCTGTAK